MDYEKKYKEALERAKKMFTDKEIDYLFPELAESEDERIRKGIIAGMKSLQEKGKYTRFANIPMDSVFAWLEKQGEQKPTEWSEEDEGYMDRILEALYDYYPKKYAQSIYDWVKSLKKV